jgi:hypothetical protein
MKTHQNVTSQTLSRRDHEGRISLEYAEKKLDDLGVPQSMKSRLYKEEEG